MPPEHLEPVLEERLGDDDEGGRRGQELPLEHGALAGRSRIEGPVRLVKPRTNFVEREACGFAHAPLPGAVGGRAARAHRRAYHAIERARKRVERRKDSELRIAARIREGEQRAQPLFEVAEAGGV